MAFPSKVPIRVHLCSSLFREADLMDRYPMHVNTVERQIMWGDLDSLGIVFYPRYYEWIDGAAHLFFDSLGLPMDRLWQQRGLLFGLVETSCGYRRPGRYHDRIRITTSLEDLGAKTLVLRHLITQAAGDTVMVEGREKRICLDVSDPLHFKAVDLPPDIRQVLDHAKV